MRAWADKWADKKGIYLKALVVLTDNLFTNYSILLMRCVKVVKLVDDYVYNISLYTPKA